MVVRVSECVVLEFWIRPREFTIRRLSPMSFIFHSHLIERKRPTQMIFSIHEIRALDKADAIIVHGNK